MSKKADKNLLKKALHIVSIKDVVKAAGIKLGRPPGTSKKRENAYKCWDAINKKIDEGIPLVKIAKQYKIHRNTLRKYMNIKNLNDGNSLPGQTVSDM